MARWYLSLLQCRFQNDTCHILTCECDLLDTCREMILEDFASNCASLDGDSEVLTMLMSFMFDDLRSPPPNLVHLHQILSKLCYEFFGTVFSQQS